MAYNASQAKSPVCNDLRKSQWVAEAQKYRFHFSTVAHRDKFLAEAEKRMEWLSDSMSHRFHMPCDFSILALFQLYQQIEGRGFFVVDEVLGIVFESPMECQFEVICDGCVETD